MENRVDKRVEECKQMDTRCRELQIQNAKFEKIMNIRTDEEELRDQQDLTEEEMKNFNDLETTN